MAEWYDIRTDEWVSFDVPMMTVDRRDDAEPDVLYGPTGDVLAVYDYTPIVGFARVIGE